MRRRLWVVIALVLIVMVVTWVIIPRELLPDYLRRAGSFQGKPTAYWIETLRTSKDIKDRRDAAYALAIISSDCGLDREAEEVLPVLIDGLKDPDEWIRRMSANALGPMGRFAAPAVPALMAEAADHESDRCDAAILALGRMGPVAKEAVPVLLKVYREDADPYRRQFVVYALKRIDPKAAAAAGVR